MADDVRNRWRRWLALLHDGVDKTVGLVREGQESAARGAIRVTDQIPGVAGPARTIDQIRRLSNDGTLASIRIVNRAVEMLVDAGLSRVPGTDVGLVPMRSDAVGTGLWVEDAALGVVNGLFGDRFGGADGEARADLDLGMSLRFGDGMLDPPPPRDDAPAVVVLVHGVTTTEWCWALDAERYHGDAGTTFGSLLQRDLGLEPVFARYNSGRTIADNGARLAAELESLCAAWSPARLVLLGHSMGGLVVLSALESAGRDGSDWVSCVSDVVSLSTPYQGAPLAMAADRMSRALGAIDVPTTRVLSGVLEMRSDGLRDLQAPEIEDLLPGIRYAFLSATLAKDPKHAKLVGDLLVPDESAQGPALRSAPIENRHFGGVLHHQIQCHPEVYAAVREVLERH